MGKSEAVRIYQKARLEEWIGDFARADVLYDELEKNDEEFASIMRPSIAKRKRKLERGYELDINNIEVLDSKKKLISDAIVAKIDSVHALKGNNSIWKYSVRVVSRVNDLIRFEIRGYNPQGQIPDLQSNMLQDIMSLQISNYGQEPIEGEPDLIWFLLSYDETDLYISVDKWGLLSGSGVASENTLNKTLGLLHIFICELGRSIL